MTQLTQLIQIMTTTPEEDKQILNEVIEEVKVQKRPRGRPRIFTPEEAIERRKAYDKRRYYSDPQKKIQAVLNNRLRKKEQNNQ